MILSERYERINALSKINKARKYLEIGVSAGKTFRKIEIPYKVAVDPKLKFDLEKFRNENTYFHEVTSDHFFSNLANQHQKFDLIYIDGLHTFPQTYRDFCASLGHSHDKTIWLIDDTVPNNWVESLSNTKIMGAIRKLTRSKNTLWMGDVYKLVLTIHDFYPQFSFATFPEHGQTVVWRQTRTHFMPVLNCLKRISNMGFQHFRRLKDTHMNMMEPKAILEAVRNGLGSE